MPTRETTNRTIIMAGVLHIMVLQVLSQVRWHPLQQHRMPIPMPLRLRPGTKTKAAHGRARLLKLLSSTCDPRTVTNRTPYPLSQKPQHHHLGEERLWRIHHRRIRQILGATPLRREIALVRVRLEDLYTQRSRRRKRGTLTLQHTLADAFRDGTTIRR